MWRRVWVVVVGLLALIVVIGLLNVWMTDEYALTPGNATPVAGLIHVRGVATNSHSGQILFTDVYLQSLSVWQWVTMHFQSHVQFVSADELVDPGVSTSELVAQGFLEMRDAKQAAEVEAFRTLGWKVPGRAVGTLITGVVESSPASRNDLRVGDEITGVDGRAVRSSCQLVRYVHALKSGTPLHLTVKRVDISPSGTLTWKSASLRTIVSATPPAGTGSSGCSGVSGSDRSWIGVTVENDYTYALPASVRINTANIGGPSAGLAMTLSLINKLSAGSLSGHHVVAATGTISTNGVVGDVGGVAEKTIAVARAGAKYFIVPDVEVATAKAQDQSGLRILGVDSLTQALRDLRKIGGVDPVPLTRPS